jgi:curved DNA-binding protein
MDYRDYYATLGVPRTASQAEIKKAFRKLARKHHPDVNKTDPGAEARFKEVSEANEVLSDPEKRKLYDQLGADWEAYQHSGASAGGRGSGADPFAGFHGQGGGAPGGIRFEFHGNPEDMAGFSDFFRTFFGGGAGTVHGASEAARPSAGRAGGRRSATRTTLEDADLDDLLGGLAGAGFGMAGGFTTPASTRGRGEPGSFNVGAQSQSLVAPDARGDVEISLDEVFHGTQRLVQVGDRRLEVKIPRGVADGKKIRLSGTAGSGPGAGNVYLTVRVRPHPVFTRNGADLSRDLPITLGEALLGGEVAVPTLTGRVMLRIPAETQTGRAFRLARQGLPRFGSEERGDLYVRVRLVLPTGLDDEAKRLAGQFVDHVEQPDPRAVPTRRT